MIIAAQQTANGIPGKAPAHQEGGLPGTLGSLFRETVLAELPQPDLPSSRKLVCSRRQRLIDSFRIDSCCTQLLQQPRIAITRTAGIHTQFRIPCVGQQAAILEIVEQDIKFIGRLRMRSELPGQLGASVLTPGQ